MSRTQIGLTVVVVTCAIGVRTIWRSADQAEPSKPYSYDAEDFVRFGHSKGLETSYYFGLRRDVSGQSLFLSPYDVSSNSQSFSLIISNGVVRKVKAPGRITYQDAQGQFVAWTDDFNEGVLFTNGHHLKLPQHALFDVDPGGEYFLIGEKPCSSWIGRIESAADLTCLSTQVLGTRIFLKNGRIIICGFSLHPAHGAKMGQVPTCLFFKENSRTYELEDEVSFAWAGGVVDVDPYRDRLLLVNRSDLFLSLYMFDLTSRRKIRVSGYKGFSFFLTHDVLRAKPAGD